MDAVYMVRRGRRNEELRYSLRTLHQHYPQGRVWVFGHLPEFVADGSLRYEYVPQYAPRNRYDNVMRQMLAICEHPEVSDTFALFNDDFFLLEPHERFPVYYKGRLEDSMEVWRSYRSRVAQPTDWTAAGLIVGDMLEAQWGITEAWDFSTHTPLPVRKADMLEVVEAAMGLARGRPLQLRNLYANIVGLKPEVLMPNDCKVTELDAPLPDTPLVSTSAKSFYDGRIGQQLRLRFPEPSPYEG